MLRLNRVVSYRNSFDIEIYFLSSLTRNRRASAQNSVKTTSNKSLNSGRQDEGDREGEPNQGEVRKTGIT